MPRPFVTIGLVVLMMINGCGSSPDPLSRIDALQQSGKVDEAVNELFYLVGETPDDPYLKLRLAHGLTISNGPPQAVINFLDDVLQLAPDDHRARYLRFQACMFNNQPDQAVEDIRQLCARFPEHDFLLADRADALLFSNQLEACKAHVRQAFTSIKMTKAIGYRLYVDNVYANLFLGHRDTALWDVAFLPDRGFERNDALMTVVSDSTLVLSDVAVGSNYHAPALAWEELNDLFGRPSGQR